MKVGGVIQTIGDDGGEGQEGQGQGCLHLKASIIFEVGGKAVVATALGEQVGE